MLKIAALIIVAAFIFELFAFQKGDNTPVGPDVTQPDTNATTVFGIAIANGTVVSYGDALGVSIAIAGNDTRLNETIEGLKKDGFIAYTKNEQNKITLNLAKGANTTEAVSRLSKLNVTLASRAEISFKEPLTFQTANGPVVLSGKSIRITMDPSVPVGYKIGIKISANLQDDKIVESMYDLITIKKDLIVVATVAKMHDEYIAIGNIPWENRDIDMASMTMYLSSNLTNVSIQPIPSHNVTFSKPISDESLQSILALNLSYLRNYSNNGIYVTRNFTDSGKVKEDLLPIISKENASLLFPYSNFRATFATENFSQQFFESAFENATIFFYRMLTLRIGEVIYDEENKPYTVINRDYTDWFFNTNDTVGTSPVAIRANLFGNKLINYTVVEEE
jgi:hypothetical protein